MTNVMFPFSVLGASIFISMSLAAVERLNKMFNAQTKRSKVRLVFVFDNAQVIEESHKYAILPSNCRSHSKANH